MSGAKVRSCRPGAAETKRVDGSGECSQTNGRDLLCGKSHQPQETASPDGSRLSQPNSSGIISFRRAMKSSMASSTASSRGGGS